MNLKIKNKLFLLACILFYCVTGCKVFAPDQISKESIVLMTQEQMMKKLSDAYEGEFTCLEFKSDEKNKTVDATVRCNLSGKTFDFEVEEDHLVDNYFYTYYKAEGVATKYYSARYETEIKKAVETMLDEKFSEVKNKITYRYNGVVIKNDIKDRFDSAEAYINSLKSDEYMRVSYYLDVPFAENENKEFELLLKAYDVKWVYVSAVYNQH